MRKLILPVVALVLIAFSGTAMANSVNRDDVRHYKTTTTAYHGGVEKYVPNTRKHLPPRHVAQHHGKKQMHHRKHGPKHHARHGRHHARDGRMDRHQCRHCKGWQNRGGDGWNHRLDYSHANDDRGQ
jgi:hypothetical protein